MSYRKAFEPARPLGDGTPPLMEASLELPEGGDD